MKTGPWEVNIWRSVGDCSTILWHKIDGGRSGGPKGFWTEVEMAFALVVQM
jgi:hypothetical protein